jgi:UvrD-like helicase C-terminal domain
VPGVPQDGADPDAVAALKAEARMAEVVQRAVFRHVGWPSEPLRLRWSSRAISVRSVPGSLELRAAAPERFTRQWLHALRQALDAEGSVGLIGADPKIPELRAELERQGMEFRMVERFDLSTRLSLVPASTVKGLEFDQVVLVEPADAVDADRHGLRRLYIALTRAVSHLWVVVLR